MDLTDKKAFCDSKIKEWQGKREAFCKETGLHKDGAREWIGGGSAGKSNIDKADNAVGKTALHETLNNNGGSSDFSGISLRVSNNDFCKIQGITYGAKKSIADASSGCNPNFYVKDAKERGYTINCQNCAITMLARLQGATVRALPFDAKNNAMQKISWDINTGFIDKKTKQHPKYLVSNTFENKDELLKTLAKSIKRDNIYLMAFPFYRDGNICSHVVSLVQDDSGQLNVIDPQNNKRYADGDLLKYLENIAYTKKGDFFIPIEILRIDDMDLSLDIASKVLEASDE